MDKKERIQKILARVGIASRRKAEELIIEGKVTVNGKIAGLGDKATWGQDAIKVSGKLLHHQDPSIYVVFNKPRGVISTLSDPGGRPTLSAYLSKLKTRVFPVGRLDFASEGLILLTNDGQFTEDLQKNDKLLRIYHVKIKGHPTMEEVSRLEKGARIDNRMVRPYSVRIVEDFASKAKVEIVFQGSGAVNVKGLFEAKGFLVDRIVRVGIGHLTLGALPPGEFRVLEESQIKALLAQPELAERRLKFEAEKAREGSLAREERLEKVAARELEAKKAGIQSPTLISKKARKVASQGPKLAIKIAPRSTHKSTTPKPRPLGIRKKSF